MLLERNAFDSIAFFSQCISVEYRLNFFLSEGLLGCIYTFTFDIVYFLLFLYYAHHPLIVTSAQIETGKRGVKSEIVNIELV